jgi:hypothetical protein
MPKPATVEAYVESLDGWRREVVVRLRTLIKQAAPEAKESIKWAQPVYESNGPFGYIRAFPRSVIIGFWRGAEIVDPEGILEGDGSRMKHVKIIPGSSIPAAEIQRMVRDAIRLNEEKGDPTLKR